MIEKWGGPLLVMVAALLWGTDSLFRFPAVRLLDPTVIVFIEHVVGIAALAPFVFRRHGGSLFKLGAKEWLCCLIIGGGGGAIATVLFTAAFRYLNPSVVILLQKLQPVFTVLFAGIFIGERPEGNFYPWAAVALGAGLVLSFPDFDFGFMLESGNLHAKGVIYALSAAGIWSVSTVAGKRLLQGTPPAVATFWRYGFGTGALVAILWLASVPMPAADALTSKSMLIALAYLSFMTGLFPMLAYYGGLARTPAIVATFVELLYPVSAVILNTVILHSPLSQVQMIAGAVLLLAVTMISR